MALSESENKQTTETTHTEPLTETIKWTLKCIGYKAVDATVDATVDAVVNKYTPQQYTPQHTQKGSKASTNGTFKHCKHCKRKPKTYTTRTDKYTDKPNTSIERLWPINTQSICEIKKINIFITLILIGIFLIDCLLLKSLLGLS